MPADVFHHIDEPPNWNNGTPILIVRGWCFDQRGDTVVAVEAANPRQTIRAPVGLARPDVGAAFEGKPGSATSGFCFWLRNRPTELGTVDLHAVHRDGSRTLLRTFEPRAFGPSEPA